jgi:predicted nucleic acid-binding protein
MAYLLDSTWSVWWLRGRSTVVKRVRELESSGLATSIATVAELYEGVEVSKDPAASRRGLMDFLGRVEILPFTDEVAERFGREAARLERLGQKIPDFDLVIAATALTHGLTLLTSDDHFKRVAGLDIYTAGAGER